ncbi:SDR family NAD(P)-dependent oxidoreductase [Phyllobacterium chamaecytisi]|uniref:SDR family NAD(P)-dependent oxidoreductase n=1 Tax=Phyllobacterium chamaecytisi TaxID=2876082 RepID=UPI001CCF9CA3|nr:SDR family oxidoreductase [Phyllobacterium sp. KW56]MBZ9605546.1 SDR family oxidoreductase [Phyllobacterium sp. KW56]
MTSPLFSMSGSTVLVTGAGGGIGAAITGAFLANGATVIATDANQDALERALAKVEGGDRAVTMTMDVTSEKEIERVMDAVAEQFGRLDALVNNAGIKSTESLLFGDKAKIDRTMEINSGAVLLCSKLIVNRFMKEGGGRIVNIGSSLSSQGAVFNYQAGGADYCFSKAVVHDLTRLLAYECAPYGINVNGVAPGIIDTPMHGRPREETEARHAGRIPLGRVGSPEDVAGIAVFLTSPASAYITGQIVHVNGGMLMNG